MAERSVFIFDSLGVKKDLLIDACLELNTSNGIITAKIGLETINIPLKFESRSMVVSFGRYGLPGFSEPQNGISLKQDGELLRDVGRGYLLISNYNLLIKKDYTSIEHRIKVDTEESTQFQDDWIIYRRP